MAREIAEQPAMFRRILRDGWSQIERIAREVRRREPRMVLFLARGSSENATLYAQYLVEVRLSLPTGFLSPSTATVYGASPKLAHTLVIAVSQSGASPDLLESLQRARETGATTLSITNDSESLLAQVAEFHIDLQAGPERAVTATKTYTAELLTLFCLVEALASRDASEAADLPARAEEILKSDDNIAVLADQFREVPHCVTLSRGYNFATAKELALKLTETSYLVAVGLSAAELLHGPIAMIGPGFPVVAIVPGSRSGALMFPVLERLRDAGARTMVVGDPSAMPLGATALPLARLGPEELSPILMMLPLQRLVWHLAMIRGEDPDQPRGLVKLTQTW